MFDKPKLSEPNEQGFQFGINKELTKYTHESQPQWGGKDLPSVAVTVLEVWKDNKIVSYLLVDEKTNEPFKEVSGYEACTCAIDAFKLSKQGEL